MDLLAFAAARRTRLERADVELAPFVVSALSQWKPKGSDWYADLIEAASVLWLETFMVEVEDVDPAPFMEVFTKMLATTLEKTKEPANPPSADQVHRITYWLSTVTVNDATFRGNAAAGGERMRWTTMKDESVRGTHRAADGQIAGVRATFDIGGFKLRYPGEPVGPPEIWMNCRCILTPARVEGAFDMTDVVTAAAITDEVDIEPVVDDDDDEMIEDDLEDDEDEITEIPVHGILAPENTMSGDYRMFADEAVTNRMLPLPLRYEFVSTHGGTTSEVVTVGRVDAIWREDDGMIHYDGALMLNRHYTPEVIEGILDRTIRGVSLDGDMGVIEVPEGEEGALSIGMEADNPLLFTEIRVAGLTIVPIPAFEEAYIALGHHADLQSVNEAGEVSVESALAACGCADGAIADADVETYEVDFREVDSEERKRLAKDGNALPDGSYPIANVEDLKNAIQAIGRAKDPAAAKAHIKKRARALGHPELIPEEWGADVIDFTALSSEELAAYDAMTHEEQEAFIDRHLDMIIASAFAPGTKDGPGWITHPIPTARIRRYWVRGKGAAKIRWGVPGDFNRCRRQLAKYVQNPEWLAGLCANMHKEAIGVWPGQEGGGRGNHSLIASAAPAVTLVASGTIKSAVAFKDPGFTQPTPITIEGNRFYGHLAAWGVCHIGIQDACVVAPHSTTNYAMFRTGVVNTEEGRIPVGQITMGTGHANIKASMQAAVEHYDHTGTVIADVAAGEDQFGIWVSGLLRPGLTDEQVDAIAAAALSGDWRRVGTSLELVAALCVNVPGFPIPRVSLAASGDTGQESLVAAGIVTRQHAVTAGLVPSAEEIAGIVRAAVAEYRAEEEKTARLNALAPFAERARARSIERVKGYFERD